MARKCDLCGKGRTVGKSRAHKYGGKWAMRAQEKPRLWNPNLQSYTLNGEKVKLCTRCIKKIKFELKKTKKAAEALPKETKAQEKKDLTVKNDKLVKKSSKKAGKSK